MRMRHTALDAHPPDFFACLFDFSYTFIADATVMA
jgi:hypothetical protein